MDFIEDQFKKHKDQFNYIEPSDNDWERLATAMDSAKKESVRWGMFEWTRAAAILVIGLLLGLNIYTQKDNHNELTGLNPDMMFPDLSLPNPEGDPVPLSTLKGKVVLVEFWASYCMVCTQEHCYYFEPLYDTYKDKGFEIYSVSIDSVANNWVQAIERDQLDWIQVSDLLGSDSPINEQFAVHSLPTNYLLDKDGKILAKNVDVTKLEETLNDLLALQ